MIAVPAVYIYIFTCTFECTTTAHINIEATHFAMCCMMRHTMHTPENLLYSLHIHISICAIVSFVEWRQHMLAQKIEYATKKIMMYTHRLGT
jgi:hypothetical protein